MLCPTIVSDFENNLILYFYSAMPQVLGTMLALLGAFYPARSGRVKNEIRDINNDVQGKTIFFIEDNKLDLYRKSEKNSLKSKLPGSEKLIAEKIYQLEIAEILFENDLKYLAKINFLDTTDNQVRIFYTSFVEHYHHSFTAFNNRINKIREENSYLDENYSELKIQNYLSSNRILEIIKLMANSKEKIHIYNQMIQIIRNIFAFNGCILIMLILSFTFLKYSSHTIFIHNIFLYVGVFFTIISVYSMILYVYNAVGDNYQSSLFGLHLTESFKKLVIWVTGKLRK